MTPRISILMGAYNEEATIDRAIASLAAQTFRDWELICVDDASTDRTYECLRAWQARDERIRPMHNEANLRLCGSLNRAIEAARGSIAARMDADDIAHPDRLEKQLSFLDAHPEVAFVSSLIHVFDDDGPRSVRGGPACPTKADFLKGSPFAHPALMIRMEALRAMKGYRISPITRRTEDYDLFMRLYEAGYVGHNLQEPLLDYYESPESIKKRKYRYRVDEMRVRFEGFKRLGLMPRGLPYCVKPLLVGLLPGGVWLRVQERRGEKETRV